MPRQCSLCKKMPARPRQWNCRSCHNASMRRYRARHKGEVERLKQTLRDVTFDNAHSRAIFEKKFGKNRHVIIMENDRSMGARCSGEVVEFLPFGRVSIITEDREVIRVSLERLEGDDFYNA